MRYRMVRADDGYAAVIESDAGHELARRTFGSAGVAMAVRDDARRRQLASLHDVVAVATETAVIAAKRPRRTRKA